MLNGSVSNAYTISKVVGNHRAGGLVGYKVSYDTTTITHSYWSNEMSEVNTSGGGTCLSLEDMKKKESYEGWDFESGTVWVMKEFPELILNIETEE